MILRHSSTGLVTVQPARLTASHRVMLGGDHADHADLDILLLEDGIAVGQRRAVGGIDVAGQDLGILLGHHLLGDIQAIVVLVVARHPDVIADGVHGRHHGVHVVVQEKLGRIALDGVACINHQGIGGAELLDGCGLLGYAAAGVGLVGRVVPWIKFAVGVAGGQDLQIHAERPETGRRRRSKAGDGCSGGSDTGCAHKSTPGDHFFFHNFLTS